MQHAVLLLAAAISFHSFISAASAAAAYLAQPQQSNSITFVETLANSSVSHIVLLTNYSIGTELDDYKYKPLNISRNISVTGFPGTFPVLDLQWKRGRLLLCSTCVFTFNQLVLANERQGVGPAYDIFIGKTGSVVETYDIYRLRYACTSAQYSAEVARSSNRSNILPGRGAAQQLQFRDAAYQGLKYPNPLVNVNFTADIPFAVQEGRGPSGGYAVGDYNVTRLCMGTVSDECLQRMSSDACVMQLIDSMRTGVPAAASHHGLSTAALAAAIAVAVAAVLLLAIAAAVLLVRKRQRQQQRKVSGGDLKDGLEDASAVEAASKSSRPSYENNILKSPLGGNKPGWELTASHTNPLVDIVGDGRMHFGELIGSGAFGLVYKARWAGQQVAVKVIEHEPSAAEAVTNEIQLLLSFNHPNIVRALHYVTYTQTTTTTSSSAKSHNSSGSASGAAIGRKVSIDGSRLLLPTVAAAAAGPAAAGSATASDAAAAAAAAGTVSAAQDKKGQLLPLQDVSGNSGGSRGLQRTTSGAHSTSGNRGPRRSTSGAADGAAAAAAAAAAGAGFSRDQRGGVNDSHSNSNSSKQLGPHLGSVRSETWLVTEYCDLGTLHHNVSLIHEADNPPPGQLLSVPAKLRLLLLLQDAARGMQTLHAQHTVHGDLNSRNVLVCSSASSPCGMVAKLADLGLSRVLQQHKTHRTTQTVGTMSHMAPEVLRHGRMSAASDVYSFGIMLHTVFTNEEAFRSLHYGQFFQTVVLEGRRPPLSTAVPTDVLMLMERCWAADPADRPSAERLLELLGFLIQVRQKNLAPRIT